MASSYSWVHTTNDACQMKFFFLCEVFTYFPPKIRIRHRPAGIKNSRPTNNPVAMTIIQRTSFILFIEQKECVIDTYWVNSRVAFLVKVHLFLSASSFGMSAGSSYPIKYSENFIAGKSNLLNNLQSK